MAKRTVSASALSHSSVAKSPYKKRAFHLTGKPPKQIVTYGDAFEQIKEMRKFMAEIECSEAKASSFLTSTGIYSKKGNLKKAYK